MSASSRAWHPPVPGVREAYHATTAHAYPAHTHDDWTVMLVDDGAVSYDLARHGHFATTNALTLLPPGIPHDGHPADDSSPYTKRVLYLEPDWLPRKVRQLTERQPTLPLAAAMRAAQRIHAALNSAGDTMAAEHWVLVLRHAILTALGAERPALRDVPLATRMRDLLDDRYLEALTVADAARSLDVHPSHATRVFSDTYGIAPHQYVIARRVDHARRLLLDGHSPADVAAMTGFHDQAHLTRHFRRILGTTPAAFTK